MIAPRTGQRSLLWLAPFLASLLHAAAPLRAQESLADLAPFREGCQALADERFGTAATHFRTCWELLEDSATDGPEGNFVAARLLEALVKDGAASAAVAWYDVQAEQMLRGAPTVQNVSLFTQFPMSGADLVNVLLGGPPLEAVDPDPTTYTVAWDRRQGAYRLGMPLRAGGELAVFVRHGTWTLAGARQLDASGDEVFELTAGDFAAAAWEMAVLKKRCSR